MILPSKRGDESELNNFLSPFSFWGILRFPPPPPPCSCGYRCDYYSFAPALDLLLVKVHSQLADPGTAILLPNSSNWSWPLHRHYLRWVEGGGGHGAEASPCSCLSVGLPTGSLCLPAMSTPEAASSWGLVITENLTSYCCIAAPV